ncbi:MAG: polysaccharide deacetylase family protein [Clostridia bacterium]|nr:polysaccharide deacetylase family protein [Clostridia bacterium]
MKLLMRYPGGKTKALTFSYDDGVEQDIRLIEILDKHHMKGTFNINSGLYSPEGTVFAEGQVHRRMTKSMCEKLYKNHEVALHSLTHPYLESIPASECVKEVYQDRVNLENLTGKLVRGMAYPYGTCSDSVVEVLRNCGIAYSRTTVSTNSFKLPTDWLRLPATCHHRNPELMNLAKQFVEADNTIRPCTLFYLWGHAYEFEMNDNWHVIEEFTEYMADREDIWYATNIEIYDYIKKYEQLQFNAECTMCYNPTDTELFFYTFANQKIVSVKPGQTLMF